jgi:ApbE superfamily uncharacterized protein (UPF0280 family)
MSGACAALLADGRRLHMQHGPIDLIIEAFGAPSEVDAAYLQARRRFETVLGELVGELAILRRPVRDAVTPTGSIARAMTSATRRFRPAFITPMAAVAGAVADEVLAAMLGGRRLDRAYVNNGGDIALYLAPGESFDIGFASSTSPPALAGHFSIEETDPVRGVATSGRQGRSLSLGIADAVTVLAETAATADAAATLIGNAVDLPGHPAVRRRPAHCLDPDSDLGHRRVTLAVGRLTDEERDRALEKGLAAADGMRQRGLIRAAALCLAGHLRLAGDEHARMAPPSARPALEREAMHA